MSGGDPKTTDKLQNNMCKKNDKQNDIDLIGIRIDEVLTKSKNHEKAIQGLDTKIELIRKEFNYSNESYNKQKVKENSAYQSIDTQNQLIISSQHLLIIGVLLVIGIMLVGLKLVKKIDTLITKANDLIGSVHEKTSTIQNEVRRYHDQLASIKTNANTPSNAQPYEPIKNTQPSVHKPQQFEATSPIEPSHESTTLSVESSELTARFRSVLPFVALLEGRPELLNALEIQSGWQEQQNEDARVMLLINSINEAKIKRLHDQLAKKCMMNEPDCGIKDEAWPLFMWTLDVYNLNFPVAKRLVLAQNEVGEKFDSSSMKSTSSVTNGRLKQVLIQGVPALKIKSIVDL